MTELHFPDNLDTRSFLRQYWQKLPLLCPSALPDLHLAVAAADLADLACKDDVESRIVMESSAGPPWQVRHGPFEPEVFATLPRDRWTLLIQDMDTHAAEFRGVKEYFRFLPDWRIDDIMVSYAADRGSVGPHADHYDVFLIQVQGIRRWSIQSAMPAQPALREDCELRILRDFSPDRSWRLMPGDMLYLPPGVAHWGVAEGDCVTCSVGFRAPGDDELLGAWCDGLLRDCGDPGRYTDPDLELQEHRGEITPQALARARNRLVERIKSGLKMNPGWFGRLVTEQKTNLEPDPCDQPMEAEELMEHYARGESALHRQPGVRLAFSRGDTHTTAYLFANGESFPFPHELWPFLAALTATESLGWTEARPWARHPPCRELLRQLHNRGCFAFGPP